METREIRKEFGDFFVLRGHQRVDSGPLVPKKDDGSLLFTNAGMVQFKDVFARSEENLPPAVSCQLCMRAGGKHNDLDNVGHTGRHHTLFEMLGNFSFGGYFKEDAIAWAWEFLKDVLRLDMDRIWVTTHPEDDESPRVVDAQDRNPR